jgi:DNA-binding transcriptional MocR family regulator
MFHIQLIPIQGDESGMSAIDLDKKCSKTNIHGIFLMPSCCNPTTHMISNERKIELAEIIKKHRLILIEDDIHASFTVETVPGYKQPMFNLIPNQTVYIYSTSKTICSGLRVAYMMYGESFAEKITQGLYNINTKTSSLDVEIISELIFSGKALEVYKHKMSLLEKANRLYNEFFPSPNDHENPISYFRWLPIKGQKSGLQVENDLKKQQVHVLHSERFISGGQSSHNQYLRISLSATNSFEELKVGLNRLEKFFKE